MKKLTLNTNSEFNEKNINLTIGNFDGLHHGHQKIIEKLITISKLSNFQSTVLSFSPHPREYFSMTSFHSSKFSVRFVMKSTLAKF